MKADEIAKIQQEFPGISDPKEFQYLAYVVYCGHIPSYTEFQNLRGFLHCTSASAYTYSEQLTKKEYIYRDTTAIGCREQWFMKVALFVLNHYSSWIESFEKLRPLRSDVQKYLWNIAVFISSRQFEEAKRLPRPQPRKSYEPGIPLDKYVSPLIQNSGYDEIATILGEDELQRLIKDVLNDALTRDNITKELLQRLDGIIRNHTGFTNLFHQECSDKAARMFDQIGAYYYFAFGPEQPGIPFTPAKNDTYWSLGCKGIDYLIRGDLYKAREQFGLALLDFNSIKKTSHDAFTFDDPILTYFYGLCIYKSSITPECSGVKSIEKALTAFQSVGTRHCNHHIGVTIILNYIDSTDAAVSNVVKTDVIGMIEKNDMPLNRLYASLILGYFKIHEDDSVKSSIGEMDWIPSTKILCHEVSPYIAVGFEMREELNQLYGGAPVLSSIKRKEDWEVLLHDLRTNIVAEVEAQKRIIYFLSGLWIHAIIEQKKLPNGEWDSGQTLPRVDFISCKYDSMNDVDRKVAIALGHKLIGTENDASIILPLLSGSDRVFVGDSFKRPYTPVEVEIVQPYIQFQARGTSIHIDSNICLDSDEKTLKKSSVQYYEENKYYVVNLSNLQHDLLSRILPTKELPLSALPQLKMLEEKLRHIIDVRSDLALAEAIPQLNGEKTLAVRITPDDGDFKIFFQSCPMPDGQERFAPGEGAEDIFDVENGFTKMVHRDLRGEFDVYNILRKELETKSVEFQDYQNAIISNPECLLHLLAFTHEHPDYYIVEWPEGQLLKFKGLFKPSDIDIQVVSNIDWFKIQGKISVGGGRFLSIKELINSFKEAGDSEYIRVGDKEYMKMSKTLRKHLAELSSLATGSKGGSLTVPQYRIGALAEVLGNEGGLNATIDQGYTNLLEKMKAAYSMDPAIPEGLNAELRPYQLDGYKWLTRLSSWGAGACLADDMGLGKTLQTLAYLLSRSKDGPSLVVAPKSVAPNWKQEAEKFTPSLNVTILNNEKKKKEMVEKAGPQDIIVITYGLLVTQTEALSKKMWNVICLDEAHQIKNKNTRTSNAAMELHSNHRMILTGTPIQNHLGDLWNLFQFINPGMLGPWQDFLDKYIRSGEAETEETREKLRSLTTPFILRRTKESVLKDLPEKISYPHLVELSNEEMLVYEKCRADAEEFFNNEMKKKEKSEMKISFFEMLTRLRLISNAVQLAYPDWKRGSSKVNELMDILENITETKANKVLVFSQFTSFLEIVSDELNKMGIQHLYLDGQTSMKERERNVKEFQEGDCQVFLISLKAGGLGLNLTSANYVILMDPWWNPAIENQAADRAHRIGQKRSVTVIRMVSAQTIEEKILKLHEKKQDLADKMLEGTAETSSLSMDDILDLVSPYR
ncbi:MAG: SNF2 family helicase [Bacteroidales bacterium]|nr:SNF2 family helicase [Bacteroidales bacterium]